MVHDPAMPPEPLGAASDTDAVAAIRAARRLRGLITSAEFAAGSRLPAERELALLVDCSRATVRRALITLEAEGLVAQSSARVRRVAGTVISKPGGRRIAVLGGRTALGSLRGGTNSFIYVAASACRARLRATGCAPLTTVAATRTWGDLLSQHGHIDAVVALSDVATQSAITGWLAQPGRQPLVVWAESLPVDWSKASAFDCVRHDHRAGATALVHALAARGCRRPVVVWWEDPVGHTPLWWEADRLAGYRDTARALGLANLEVIRLPRSVGGATPADEAEVLRRLAFGFLYDRLRGKTACDGIFCIDDQLLSAVDAAVRMTGLTSGTDVLLAGYDHGQAYGAPSNTVPAWTVDQDPTSIGSILAEHVGARLADPTAPTRHILVPPTVVAINGA